MSRSHKKIPIVKDKKIDNSHNQIFRRINKQLINSIKVKPSGFILGYDEPNRLENEQPTPKQQKEVVNQYDVRDYFVRLDTNEDYGHGTFIKDKFGGKKLRK